MQRTGAKMRSHRGVFAATVAPYTSERRMRYLRLHLPVLVLWQIEEVFTWQAEP
jgi:hypothetical protein